MKHILLSKLISLATLQCDNAKADLISVGINPSNKNAAIIVCHTKGDRFIVFQKLGILTDVENIKLKENK